MIWTPKDAEILKTFLDSETGQSFFKVLHLQRPSPHCEEHEHQAAYKLGSVAGFELAEVSILKLSLVKLPPKVEPQADYGVKEKATPA